METTDPIRIAFDVRCSVAHAFSTWTGRTSLWSRRSIGRRGRVLRKRNVAGWEGVLPSYVAAAEA